MMHPASQTFTVLHAVSGQGPWLHWHAISTSLELASLQAWPQYLSFAGTKHRQGRCPHFFWSIGVIVVLLISSYFPKCPSKLSV